MSWTKRYTCDRCGFQAARLTEAQRHDSRHLTEDIYAQPRPTIDPRSARANPDEARTMTDLDRLDTLASKATPGPWIRPWGAQHLMSPFDLSVVMGDDQATLDYIAAVSPDVVQSLVARVRDAEAALEDLVGVLTEPDAVWDKTWPKRRNDAIAKARAALATAQGGEK